MLASMLEDLVQQERFLVLRNAFESLLDSISRSLLYQRARLVVGVEHYICELQHRLQVRFAKE